MVSTGMVSTVLLNYYVLSICMFTFSYNFESPIRCTTYFKI